MGLLNITMRYPLCMAFDDFVERSHEKSSDINFWKETSSPISVDRFPPTKILMMLNVDKHLPLGGDFSYFGGTFPPRACLD